MKRKKNSLTPGVQWIILFHRSELLKHLLQAPLDNYFCHELLHFFYTFTPKSEKKQNKWYNVPCRSAAKEVSFEWSHHRISSTELKVRTT